MLLAAGADIAIRNEDKETGLYASYLAIYTHQLNKMKYTAVEIAESKSLWEIAALIRRVKEERTEDEMTVVASGGHDIVVSFICTCSLCLKR